MLWEESQEMAQGDHIMIRNLTVHSGGVATPSFQFLPKKSDWRNGDKMTGTITGPTGERATKWLDRLEKWRRLSGPITTGPIITGEMATK